MSFWRWISGTVTLSLVAADLADAMAGISSDGIAVYDGKIQNDGMEMILTVKRQDLKKLQKLAERKGYDIRFRERNGLFLLVKASIRRPILTVSILLVLFLTFWIPQRVFFIQVQGNQNIPTRKIVEVCMNSGISFGASRVEVRSERVKNALLQQMPQLQWAGVNTAGCVATVTVRERAADQQIQDIGGVSSLIASIDGIVTQITVTSGEPHCKVGQAVRTGDMLVSGYTDCGIAIRAGRAEGEVYARTKRHLEAVVLISGQVNAAKTVTEKKYAIIIGKNRINFYKGSGISGATCDKIHSEYYMTLPGGFTLPISLMIEDWIVAQTCVSPISAEDAQMMLSDFARWYLKEQMIAGHISGREQTFSHNDDVAVLKGSYACEEMIAKVKNEEIILPNGNDH